MLLVSHYCLVFREFLIGPEVQANQQVLHLPAVQKFQQDQANPEVLPVLDHLCRQVYQENLEFLHLLAVLDHPETQDYHFVLVVLVILVR